jgi:hypothetical protein
MQSWRQQTRNHAILFVQENNYDADPKHSWVTKTLVGCLLMGHRLSTAEKCA